MTDLCTKDEITMDDAKAFQRQITDIIESLASAIGELRKLIVTDVIFVIRIWVIVLRRIRLFYKLNEIFHWRISYLIACYMPDWLILRIPLNWIEVDLGQIPHSKGEKCPARNRGGRADHIGHLQNSDSN